MFSTRHLGPSPEEVAHMISIIGQGSLNELIDKIIPPSIRQNSMAKFPITLTEPQALRHISELAAKNTVCSTYIGMGYYGTHTPSAIARNIFENPGWYTQYTPYQAEISQGRLEALLNYQTMVTDLTGMDLANASLLDEATAATEAISMLHRVAPKSKSSANVVWVDENCFPHTIDVIRTRCQPLGITVKVAGISEFELNDDAFAICLQYPNGVGTIENYSSLTQNCHENDIKVCVISDLMALTLLVPPGQWGADVVVGSSQRFGVPLGYGGPHAAFFAVKDEHQRQIPGRIIGVSKDRNGNQAYRLALQTREQHIRREKATSNICTAQALLAIMAGMYAVYHGPVGLKRIATRIHQLTNTLNQKLDALGVEQANSQFFDTLCLAVPDDAATIVAKAAEHNVNLRLIDSNRVGISLDETCTIKDVNLLVQIIAEGVGIDTSFELSDAENEVSIHDAFLRQDAILTHPIFNSIRTESQLMRYIKRLENKDLSLVHSMIPLGSCTMKLNSAVEMAPLTWPEFSNIHPFAPLKQAAGYQEIIRRLGDRLVQITGFHSISFQPNSGAQGEYAGLMVIKAYHESRGDYDRKVVLIPSSAHGTNPATASLVGMSVVVVKCDEDGNIDFEDFKTKALQHRDQLGAIMITYPSTHGIFEESVRDICSFTHECGGQVYMDGANLNAQLGLTNPGYIGADVCHLNLHKTFSIPHGGGGPGMGPIGVAEHLSPYLPSHAVVNSNDSSSAIGAISSAPWGSPSILIISYLMIRMLGGSGLKSCAEIAILNANYIKARLQTHYDVLFTKGRPGVAHELIVDCRGFKKTAKVDVEDIAKRLIDYGFHAPTMSWPVAGTLMIEPTESEDLAELDRFCDAMIAIRQEISEIESGAADIADNVLKNAPHTAFEVTSDAWSHSYGREKAAYPLSYIRERKFWPSVARVDNAHGDRNLVCSCPSISEYEEATA
ncbi:MAG: aminomethyl-transferring glycine dehydrogenase [bacterium]|nr:aminomethyl-transferring glycine dehydrogenase [bacterium]